MKRAGSHTCKTGAQVREDLERDGISLKEWCRAHSVSYDIARGVIAGRIKAKRGQAHAIAVAFGMKAGRVIPASQFAPVPSKNKPQLRVVRP
ncbi:DNA-binding protein [Ramlibacter sp.]|uniref:DNA-binding protein n=1 Tax=Ramlibacter sp. TaxID=1917967 RepID=UPI003D0E9480